MTVTEGCPWPAIVEATRLKPRLHRRGREALPCRTDSLRHGGWGAEWCPYGRMWWPAAIRTWHEIVGAAPPVAACREPLTRNGQLREATRLKPRLHRRGREALPCRTDSQRHGGWRDESRPYGRMWWPAAIRTWHEIVGAAPPRGGLSRDVRVTRKPITQRCRSVSLLLRSG